MPLQISKSRWQVSTLRSSIIALPLMMFFFRLADVEATIPLKYPSAGIYRLQQSVYSSGKNLFCYFLSRLF
jgi:hypothetical protein